jgi:Mn-dependent DtxR family transcriptional regulator
MSPGAADGWGLIAMVIKWDNLPKDEQQALQRLADNLSVSQNMMERLRALGLVEEKRGGLGLSKAGRGLYAEHVTSVQRSIRRR